MLSPDDARGDAAEIAQNREMCGGRAAQQDLERGCGTSAAGSKDRTEFEELTEFEQHILSGREFLPDWPGYETIPIERHHAYGYRGCATPLLISECGRLVLDWDTTNQIYRASPVNMPDVEIALVELVGTVLDATTDGPFLQLNVYDGTGIMKVNYSSAQYVKHEERRREIDARYKIPAEVRAAAPRMMEICRKAYRSVESNQKDELRRAKVFFSDLQAFTKTGCGLRAKG